MIVTTSYLCAEYICTCCQQYLSNDTIYVNDLVPEYVDNAVNMYADDSTLQAHARDIKTVENILKCLLKQQNG